MAGCTRFNAGNIGATVVQMSVLYLCCRLYILLFGLINYLCEIKPVKCDPYDKEAFCTKEGRNGSVDFDGRTKSFISAVKTSIFFTRYMQRVTAHTILVNLM